jgi:hypothetical protein
MLDQALSGIRIVDFRSTQPWPVRCGAPGPGEHTRRIAGAPRE